GKQTPRLRIPAAPVRFGFGLAEDLAKAVGYKTPPLNRLLLEKFLEDIAVDGSRIQRELGFKPEFDLTQGWREAIDNGNW
ncbi:MAG: UDP-glucose 4-epimerase, partial [Acidobacteria bacterium]|nr:UDP-glucose 4-epimerase [Acidobacteriota bacterium]